MQPFLTVYVDGEPVDFASPREGCNCAAVNLREFLRISGEQTGKLLFDRILINEHGDEFVNLDALVCFRANSKFRTRRHK